MSIFNGGAISGAFGSVAARAADAEMQLLETVLRPLSALGFEFRGGDMFGREIYGLYVNDRSDEFVVLRYNRGESETGQSRPPLIHRGPMSELDSPMDSLSTLEFKTVQEYIRHSPEHFIGPSMPVPAAQKETRDAFRFNPYIGGR